MMTDEILTAKKVETIVIDCLFKPEEIADGKVKDQEMLVVGEGIVRNFGFHKTRLESHREEIIAMLKELPDQFHKTKGGGWSFLNACNDKHDRQWTGMQSAMEELFALGTAIGKVHWQMKSMASMMPGGMPFVMVDVE